jgi:pilus assembly protein CpaC
MRLLLRTGHAGLLLLWLAAWPWLTPGAAVGQSFAAALMPVAGSVEPGRMLHITVGQSVVLRNAGPLRRVFLGNPAVLESFNASPEELVLTAKTAGVSSLILWNLDGSSIQYTVSADVDPSGLRRSLAQLYPSDAITVDGVEGRLALTGTVPTQAMSDEIAKLAMLYTKDIANGLRVVPVHGKQVRLKLRIVEVDRTRLEQFGVNFFVGQGGSVGSIGTQQFASALSLLTGSGANSVSASDPLNLFVYNFANGLGVTVKDLESKNILQVLSEPTLTTLSGTPARFLSGGEFPFPVVEGTTGTSSAITIQFRPYGVKVDFTPVVNEDGTIRLKISPEVSTLDYTNAVSIAGFTIPALATRRAETEVELRDGQSFALSGLLDHRTTENLSRIPGISSVPILGQLFRSKNNTHSVTELVILATVHVVDPLNDASLVPEPKMAVPNLSAGAFDQELNKEQFRPKKQ